MKIIRMAFAVIGIAAAAGCSSSHQQDPADGNMADQTTKTTTNVTGSNPATTINSNSGMIAGVGVNENGAAPMSVTRPVGTGGATVPLGSAIGARTIGNTSTASGAGLPATRDVPTSVATTNNIAASSGTARPTNNNAATPAPSGAHRP